MINVFISHNRKDKPKARAIAKKLVQYGIHVWIDEAEIKPGDSLIKKIRDGIEYVDYLVALISKNSVESEWVTKELDIAMNREIEERRIVVIPVLVGCCDNLPGFLKGKLWIDMITDRKLNENFPNFLSCFNVNFKKDNIKESYTDFNWTAPYIIDKLERGSEIEKFEILENIGDEDKDLFELDTFKDCLDQLVRAETGNDDLIIAILDICEYCPYQLDIKMNRLFCSLISSSDEDVVLKTLDITQDKATSKQFDKKVFALLKCNPNNRLTGPILNYLYSKRLDNSIAKKLCKFCMTLLDQPNSQYEITSLKILCKYMESLYLIDEIVNIIYEKYASIESEQNQKILSSFFFYCRTADFFYITDPRLRNNFNELLKSSISNNEQINSEIGLFLLVSESNINYDRDEIWNIINQFDDYSIEWLLTGLNDYKMEYVLNTEADVKGITKLLSRNFVIKDLVNQMLAELK